MRRVTALLALAISALMLLGPISPASAYSKPAKGKWKVEDLFGDVRGGSMKVAKNRKTIKSLKVNVSSENREACGGKKAIVKGIKAKRYGKAGGRWAYAKLPKRTGLFEPKPTRVKIGGDRVRGKLQLLFDVTGKLVNSAKLLIGSCTLDFIVRR